MMTEFNGFPNLGYGEKMTIQITKGRRNDFDEIGGSNWLFWFFMFLFCLWLFAGKSESKLASQSPTEQAHREMQVKHR